MALGEKKEITVGRALQVIQACELIASNTYLDDKTEYALGRFSDHCESVRRVYEKIVKKRKQKYDEEIKPLRELARAGTAEEKLEHRITIQNKMEDLNNYLDSLLDKKEVCYVPNFKLSDFTAKNDVLTTEKVTDPDGRMRTVEITIKAGAPLVPVKFFKLMGPLIVNPEYKDDGEAGIGLMSELDIDSKLELELASQPNQN